MFLICLISSLVILGALGASDPNAIPDFPGPLLPPFPPMGPPAPPIPPVAMDIWPPPPATQGPHPPFPPIGPPPNPPRPEDPFIWPPSEPEVPPVLPPRPPSPKPEPPKPNPEMSEEQPDKSQLEGQLCRFDQHCGKDEYCDRHITPFIGQCKSKFSENFLPQCYCKYLSDCGYNGCDTYCDTNKRLCVPWPW